MRVLTSLFLCCALLGAQDAEQLEQFTEMFAKAVQAGSLKAILDNMPEEAQAGIAESPTALRRMAAIGAKWAPSQAKKDSDTWKSFVEFLENTCKAVSGAEANSQDVRVAVALTALCRARVHAATGEPFAKEDWTGVAEQFRKLHGDEPGGGKHLASAAQALEEGGRAGGDAAADLREQATKLCLEGAEHYPGNKYFAGARHRAQLDLIDLTLQKSPSRAKKMMQEYLGSIQVAGGDVNTPYNDAVTFARRRKKLALKPKYITEKVRVSLVSLEIPLGSRWEKKASRIFQYDKTGAVLRTISFYQYKWTTNYYLGGQTYGGDNAKGLARISETQALDSVLQIKHRRKLRKTRLSRSIPSAQNFEIGGLDEDGDYVCYRVYLFKCKKTNLRTLEVSILEMGQHKKLDPEAAFVLSTIRE